MVIEKGICNELTFCHRLYYNIKYNKIEIKAMSGKSKPVTLTERSNQWAESCFGLMSG